MGKQHSKPSSNSSCSGNLIGTTINNTNNNNAINNFTIYKNNIFTCDSHGNGSYTFNPQDFSIPVGTISGSPSNLHDLYQMVGSNNISIDYYVSATGSVTGHDCWATFTLYASGILSNPSCTSNSNKISLHSTGGNPGGGGTVNSGWVPLMKNSIGILNSLQTHQECNGSGCGCNFTNYGGWNGIIISLKIDVTVNLYSYCTTDGTKNIHNDICYNYISNYIKAPALGPDQRITDYMKHYCNTTYPKGGLSIFNQPISIDQKDYNICACNMPDEYYQQFEQSIKGQFPTLNLGSIRPNCLLPACVTSTFKNNELDNCPLPQCLDIVNISNSNFATNNVNINQNQNCQQYGIEKSGTSVPAPVPVPKPSPTSENFIKKHKWLIIGIILAIFMIAIIIIIITAFYSSDDSEKNIITGGMIKKFNFDEIN